jgi:hypothetical protein
MPGFTEALACPEPVVRSDYVIVVRRGAESTYHYLKVRLAGVRGVEVTLDRRETRKPAPTTGPRALLIKSERRRAPRYFNAFGVLLVRR